MSDANPSEERTSTESIQSTLYEALHFARELQNHLTSMRELIPETRNLQWDEEMAAGEREELAHREQEAGTLLRELRSLRDGGTTESLPFDILQRTEMALSMLTGNDETYADSSLLDGDPLDTTDPGSFLNVAIATLAEEMAVLKGRTTRRKEYWSDLEKRRQALKQREADLARNYRGTRTRILGIIATITDGPAAALDPSAARALREGAKFLERCETGEDETPVVITTVTRHLLTLSNILEENSPE